MYNEYKEDSIMTEDTRKFVEEKTKEILIIRKAVTPALSVSSFVVKSPMISFGNTKQRRVPAIIIIKLKPRVSL